jgi:hypothetical protein
MIALLTSETLQMIDIIPGPHHHFKSRNDFVAGSAKSGIPKKSVERKKIV